MPPDGSARMEAVIWAAAEVLRDRLEPSAARNVVLLLVALRLLGDRAGAPAAARWPTIERDGAEGVRRAVEALEHADPTLAGAFPDLPVIEADRLGRVVAAIGGLPVEADGDRLGDVYMHLLGQFARAEGRRGGQYYTPTSIADLLAALIAPIEGVLYDPCAGTGGLLVAAAARATGPTHLVGQEINPATRRLARLNAAVHDLRLDLGARAADTLRTDLHADLVADRIVANPPFNLARWGDGGDDPRWRFGRAPAGNANLAWVQHILHHLAPGGRAAVVLANGSATAGGREGVIRGRLVDAGLVEGVVALPDLLFSTTPIPASIWVLRGTPGEVMVAVDARRLGRRVTPSRRVLDESDHERIVRPFHALRAGQRVAQPGFARTVTRELLDPERRLAPGEIVGASPREDEGPSIAALVAEVEAHAEEARRLDQALLAALSDLVAQEPDP